MKKFRKKYCYQSETIDGEVFLIDMEAGKYFAMNQTASFIWMLLEMPMSADEIIQQLINRYEVDESKCIDSINHLLEKMCRMKMIVNQDDL